MAWEATPWVLVYLLIPSTELAELDTFNCSSLVNMSKYLVQFSLYENSVVQPEGHALRGADFVLQNFSKPKKCLSQTKRYKSYIPLNW